MRIVDVTTAVVAYHGQATLVRIDTDEGLSGFGEANPDAGAGAVVGMIHFLTRPADRRGPAQRRAMLGEAAPAQGLRRPAGRACS